LSSDTNNGPAHQTKKDSWRHTGHVFMNTINSKLLKKFFTLADKRLSGEWVIIGGVVLHLVDLDYRSTSDIDIIFLNNQNHNEVSLALMEISEKLGLPLNAINRAGEYFLTKANYKRQDLIQVYIGKSITIYR